MSSFLAPFQIGGYVTSHLLNSVLPVRKGNERRAASRPFGTKQERAERKKKRKKENCWRGHTWVSGSISRLGLGTPALLPHAHCIDGRR